MYEIMKSASEEGSVRKERPYSNILVPMMEMKPSFAMSWLI